jgi:predicted TIM-barrel fold metal-dependent hydrolase
MRNNGAGGIDRIQDMKIETEMDSHFNYSDWDRRIWEEDLDSFVPWKIYDAHMHLWSDEFLPADDPGRAEHMYADMPVTVEVNRHIYPGRDVGYLALGTPHASIDVRAHNRWVAEQMRPCHNGRKHLLVTPKCPVDDIRDEITQRGFNGLKPYRIYATTGDSNQCRIHEFLTHEQMELANDLGLWVTMHLSRHEGCADQSNLDDLDEFTNRRYPKIKWILAHCARSFTYWPIREAVDRLRDMPNIWYDVSAVCDVMPHFTLCSKEDHRRILFGSDNLLACSFHGMYAAMGRYWYQIGTPTSAVAGPTHTDARPVLCIYQQLLCMKHAAELAGLSRSQVEDIFYNNAKAAFALT